MKKEYRGAFLILLSSLGFGLMPIFAKYAYKGNISVSTLLFIRFSLAALFLFAYALIRTEKIKVTKRDLIGLVLLGGVCYTLQSTLYFSAVKYISASLAVLILYTYPMIVSILSFFVDKEKLSGKMIASMGVSFVGLILIVGASIGKINSLGVLCAAGTAIVNSIYIVLGNRVVKNVTPVVTTAYVSFFAAAGLLLAGVFSGSIHFGFSPDAWPPILGLVFFSTLLSILTFFAGLELLGSTKASILCMIEPFFVILFSALLLGERLGITEGAGGLAVLAGAVMVVWWQGEKKL